MSGEGVTSVKLHKQEGKGVGLVGKYDEGKPVEPSQEDPEELTTDDFQQAANTAQETLSKVARSTQEGAASVLGSLQQQLQPGSKDDPEVKDFRAAAAEAAAEAKAYTEPKHEDKR